MARDEHFVAGSNNSGDGGGKNNNNNSDERSKKSKQNKIPQRGLGVAQLEKLRVEGQRKEALAALQASDALAIHNATGDLFQSPNSNPGPNAIPPPPGLNFPYRSIGPANEGESGRWPRLWSDSRFGFTHQQWPGLPAAVGYQFQRPPSSMLQLNSASSGISVSSSRSEPPSIQNAHNYSPDDDKIVGMKRPYPFSLGSPPPPRSLVPGHFHLRSRSAEEFPSFVRDIGPSNSTPVLGQNTSEDDVRLAGDFLTLAPPVVASPPLSSDNDSRGLFIDQENLESKHRVGLRASEEQLEFSFFPTKSQAEQTSRNGNREKEEAKIDLNLKL